MWNELLSCSAISERVPISRCFSRYTPHTRPRIFGTPAAADPWRKKVGWDVGTRSPLGSAGSVVHLTNISRYPRGVTGYKCWLLLTNTPSHHPLLPGNGCANFVSDSSSKTPSSISSRRDNTRSVQQLPNRCHGGEYHLPGTGDHRQFSSGRCPINGDCEPFSVQP